MVLGDDAVVDRVSKVESSFVTVPDDVKEVKPVVDEVHAWK